MLGGIDQAALNLLAALLLGGAIGFERQWRQRLCGLRTNALIALGAATFVMFARLFPGEASQTRVAPCLTSLAGRKSPTSHFIPRRYYSTQRTNASRNKRRQDR
jgi:putative Mg2+ transporter-C (MgtC) family protein